MNRSVHIPVLLSEVLSGLDISEGDVVVDATLGGGGHARAIAERIGEKGALIGIDWDRDAIQRAKGALAPYHNRIIFRQGNYTNITSILYESGYHSVDSILLDLGLSRDQLEDHSRGFGIKTHGPLDMRFSEEGLTTAAEIVNTYSEDDLAHIFCEYGEERHAARIARLVAETRRSTPITSVDELAQLVERRVGRRGSRIHPATRIFQALRIAVNRELENIRAVLPDAISVLRTGGRLGVITFHSIEDRIVKRYFKSQATGELPRITLVNKKVITPSRGEVLNNPASRSAKLRIVKKN